MPNQRTLLAAAAVVLVVIGAVLWITADEAGDLTTESVIVFDTIRIPIPAGWERDEQAPIPTFRSPDDQSDLWAVARSCGPDGCAVRPLAEWNELAERLPTFETARRDDNLLDVAESASDGHRILRARTAAGDTVVSVAVFADGAERYLECNLFAEGVTETLVDSLIAGCLAADVN